MSDGNRYVLPGSIDEYFETIDLHSSLLLVAFLLMPLVFLVAMVNVDFLMNLTRMPTYFFFSRHQLRLANANTFLQLDSRGEKQRH